MAALVPRDDHSSWAPVAGRLTLPTRTAGPETNLEPRAPRHPYSVLLPVGLPCRSRCRARGGLLPHPFTLTAPVETSGRFAFCGTFPGVTPAGRYPAPCFRGARTFLSGGLATMPERPSGQLTSYEMAARPSEVKHGWRGRSPAGRLSRQRAAQSIERQFRRPINDAVDQFRPEMALEGGYDRRRLGVEFIGVV